MDIAKYLSVSVMLLLAIVLTVSTGWLCTRRLRTGWLRTRLLRIICRVRRRLSILRKLSWVVIEVVAHSITLHKVLANEILDKKQYSGRSPVDFRSHAACDGTLEDVLATAGCGCAVHSADSVPLVACICFDDAGRVAHTHSHNAGRALVSCIAAEKEVRSAGHFVDGNAEVQSAWEDHEDGVMMSIQEVIDQKYVQ